MIETKNKVVSGAEPRLEKAPEAAINAAEFDYTAAAELFTHAAMIQRPPPTSRQSAAPARMPRRRGIVYRRFATSAEAIRFAIEELPPAHLAASVLAVDGERHEGTAIRALYASSGYPLSRAPVRGNGAAARGGAAGGRISHPSTSAPTRIG